MRLVIKLADWIAVGEPYAQLNENILVAIVETTDLPDVIRMVTRATKGPYFEPDEGENRGSDDEQ
jgi:hypothetical protein